MDSKGVNGHSEARFRELSTGSCYMASNMWWWKRMVYFLGAKLFSIETIPVRLLMDAHHSLGPEATFVSNREGGSTAGKFLFHIRLSFCCFSTIISKVFGTWSNFRKLLSSLFNVIEFMSHFCRFYSWVLLSEYLMSHSKSNCISVTLAMFDCKCHIV